MWGDIMKKKMGLLLICCLMVLTPITSYAKSHDIEKNVVARKIEVIPKEVLDSISYVSSVIRRVLDVVVVPM